jgi:hypothetical protein
MAPCHITTAIRFAVAPISLTIAVSGGLMSDLDVCRSVNVPALLRLATGMPLMWAVMALAHLSPWIDFLRRK